MWEMSREYEEDLMRICSADFIPWEKLRSKTVFITGATGLIGFNLVNGLLYANRKKTLGMSILALVRDEARAKERFAAVVHAKEPIQWIVGTVEELPAVAQSVDYIIHCAGQTASKAFVQRPVETIRTSILGTLQTLELARRKHVAGFVYASSMEVYGHPPKGHKVLETDVCGLSPLAVRNSYPVSKLQCESLCCAYASEYGIPVVIARLAQTFGPGVHPDDNRIFAEFGHCIQEKQDIVLRTKGETERSYLYAADAVTALLTILLKGQPGKAYNVADENTYCSIAEMAQKVAVSNNIGVRFELDKENECGYPEPVYMDLDITQLRELGWLTKK